MKIREGANYLGDKQRNIYLGLILGDTTDIEDETKEEFRTSSMAHILAVSGMHISYLVIGSIVVSKKILGKRNANIITAIIIIIYMFITGFSPSVVRAGIMAIILLFSKVFYRKNDIPTSISSSLLIILIINPFSIMNIGLQLSYAGTIGIILFRKPILRLLEKIKIKDRRIKYRIPKRISDIVQKLRELISVILSAQIAILPISLYHFNLFSSYFIITNLLVSLVVGPVFIISIIYAVLTLIKLPILAKVVDFGITIIIQISKIPKLLIGSKIYFPTPKIFQIILYYLSIIILFSIIAIKNSQKPNMSQKRVLNLVALIKYRYRQINRRTKREALIIILIICVIVSLIPKELEINFVDVGQGDSTFIITPSNKTVLIDGGEEKSKIIDYILDKGYTSIDIVLISHFDEDHVGGILNVLKELKVKEILIAKQYEDSELYQQFLEIIKQKNVKINVVKKGDIIEIEKDIYFKILWPDDNNVITEKAINNNAIVAKFIYKKFSCLFTGDIESIAEEKLKENKKELKSTILKVAHHGSKSSSTEEFLQEVQPQIALIGVGKNNKYGHPNQEVITRLKECTKQIFRTDLNGEITININKKYNVLKIKKCK